MDSPHIPKAGELVAIFAYITRPAGISERVFFRAVIIKREATTFKTRGRALYSPVASVWIHSCL